MLTAVLSWIEERTGVGGLVSQFLNEEIPASSGWKHVLGSVALFSFLVQATTGVLLAMNYAPTPTEAHQSIQYIMKELTGGSIIRGIHHWGASLMIVVVGLHMAQVFLWGGYKRPREATWLAGCVLLLLTLAYGLTGYLLPWDNRAYWGTMITVQIAGQAPVVGEYAQRLLGAEGGQLGAITFSRFYAIHVLALPPITALVMLFHVYLVRKHGVAPRPEETATKKFYPGQAFKDTVAIFLAFSIVLTLAIVAKAPLGRLADPTDTTYIPRPEWYFLFLFQLLKFFEGPLELLGSVVLPNLAIVALFLVPFLDRKKLVPVTKRTGALVVLVLAALAWGGLTFGAIQSTPKQNEFALALDAPPESWQEMNVDLLAGIGYYRRAQCAKCHGLLEVKKSGEWLTEHMISTSPTVSLKDFQWRAVAAFQTHLTPEHREAFDHAPAYAANGAALYHEKRCSSCHQANGQGQKVGPAMNGLAFRREKPWVIDHFRNPQKSSPGSSMPAYPFKDDEMEAITRFLLMLPRR